MISINQLVIHNIITIVSVIVLLVVFLFLIVKGKKDESSLAVSFSVFFVAVFFISHTIGINLSDPDLSRKVLMLNILMIFIGTYNLHAIYAMFGKAKEKRKTIIIVHLAGLFVTVFFFLFPNLFLLDSSPKMYFPNYYNPGILNVVRIIFLFGIMLPWCFYELSKVYHTSTDTYVRMQVKYFFLTMLFGYTAGFFPNFLVYDIQIDPLLGAPTAIIFAIPFLYGIIQYNLFNILVIAKRAIYYSLLVGIIGIFISLLGYLTNFIENAYPSFPVWIVYMFYALLVFITSMLVWKRLKEGDQLKYEFITTITHKLRTPMTSIRWSTENLNNLDLSNEAKIQVDYINRENTKLIELTDVLMNVSNTENNLYTYKIKSNNLSKIVDEVIMSLKSELDSRNQVIIKNYQKDSIFARFDENKIKFVIQTLIENAMSYSPTGSTIEVNLYLNKNDVIFMVEDSGIGIAREEFTKLFTKFYRGDKAVKSDTEGLGIGLYLSKEMLMRQRGKIWAESKGEGLGSKFYFSLPADR